MPELKPWEIAQQSDGPKPWEIASGKGLKPWEIAQQGDRGLSGGGIQKMNPTGEASWTRKLAEGGGRVANAVLQPIGRAVSAVLNAEQPDGLMTGDGPDPESLMGNVPLPGIMAQQGVPLFSIPHIAPMGGPQFPGVPRPGMESVLGFGAGMVNKASDFASGLTTPEMLPLAALGGVGGIPARILAGLFGAQMATQLPESVRQAGVTLQDPNATAEQKGASVADPLLLGAATLGGAHGALHETMLPDQVENPKAKTDQPINPLPNGVDLGPVRDLGTVGDVLGRIAQNKESPYAEMAQHILETKRGELLSKKLSVSEDTGGQAGVTDENGIRIHPKFANSDFPIMHEVLHALTEGHLKEPEFAEPLKQLLEAAKADAKDPKAYGFQNLDEFVAEMYSNPAFAQQLRHVRVGDRSIMDRVIDLTMSAVGRAREKGSALEAGKKLADPLLKQEQLPFQADRGRQFDVPVLGQEQGPGNLVVPGGERVGPPQQIVPGASYNPRENQAGVWWNDPNAVKKEQQQQVGQGLELPRPPKGAFSEAQHGFTNVDPQRGSAIEKTRTGEKSLYSGLEAGDDLGQEHRRRFSGEVQMPTMNNNGERNALMDIKEPESGDPAVHRERLIEKLSEKMSPAEAEKFARSVFPDRATGEPFSQGGAKYSGLSVGDTARKADKLFSEFVANRVNSERAAQLLDASDNKSMLFGREAANNIRQRLPSVEDQKALTFVIQSGGTVWKLDDFLKQIGSRNKEATAAIEHAKKNFNRLEPFAREVGDMLEGQRKLEVDKDVDVKFLRDYIKQSYQKDTGLFDMGKGGSGVSTSFLKDRVFPDYATAIENGFTPKTINATHLLESRLSAGRKLINRYEYLDQLSKLKTPTGESFTAPLGPKGKVADGYEKVEIAPGVVTTVHSEYAPIMRAITEPSKMRDNMFSRAVLKTEGALKHGMLLFDSYHLFRIARKGFFMKGDLGYNKGLSALEYDMPTLQKMVKDGEVPKETLAWVQENKPIVDRLVNNGLNVGRLSEALYADTLHTLHRLAKSLPGKAGDVAGGAVKGIETFNKYVFEKVTRGTMLETAVSEYKRLKKGHPEWSEDTLAANVSKQMNVYFGNLGRQGLIKSATYQDLLQTAFLAPVWVESMIQTEARAAKQMVQSGADLAQGKARIGSAAKGVATGILAYIAFNQVMNLATTGKPTWENEDGHKLDAKMPGGFWFSPLGDVAEMTHDVVRYKSRGMGNLATAGQMIENKLSPLGRAEEVLRTGKNFSGHDLSDTERVKSAAKSLTPTPLPLTGVTSSNPKAIGRQLYSTIGLKVEPITENFHNAELEKMTGKPVDEMPLVDRILAERDYKAKQPKMSPEDKVKSTQKALDNENKLRKELETKMDKKDVAWLKSRDIDIKGYTPTINIPKDPPELPERVTLHLTTEESKRFQQIVISEWKEITGLLRPKWDSMSDSDKAEARLKLNAEIHREARKTMLEEMKSQSDSKNESVKKNKRFSILP